jgi:hypothetical protein
MTGDRQQYQQFDLPLKGGRNTILPLSVFGLECYVVYSKTRFWPHTRQPPISFRQG